MIERVVHPYQLEKALSHVIANKGSAGVDGVSVGEIRKIFTKKKYMTCQRYWTVRRTY